MRIPILDILKCPLCSERLRLGVAEEARDEIRSGALVCGGAEQHAFKIQDGIIRFATGLNNDTVQREIAYENSTYLGSERLTDPKLISEFPNTLAELWPHTRNFGPDFEILIDHLELSPSSWVLDVGTGPCWSSRLLAQRGAQVIALDVNDADFYGLKTADILFDTHGVYFERILESMTHLPFRDATIDAITFNASFHHTPDMEKTLSECHRVLKPGASVAMINETFASMRQKLFPRVEAQDTGSHHTIQYSEFETAAAEFFELHYFVADHVRRKLKEKLSRPVGSVVANALEAFPPALKQLNSALILLTKAKRETHEPAPEPLWNDVHGLAPVSIPNGAAVNEKLVGGVPVNFAATRRSRAKRVR